MADYLLLATIVLGVVATAMLILKQPSRRIAVAFAATGALVMLAILVALPAWPRLAWRTSHEPPQFHAGFSSPAAPEPRPIPIASVDRPLVGTLHSPKSTDRAASRPAHTARITSLRIRAPGVVVAFQAGVALSLLWLLLGAVQTTRLRRTSREASANLRELFIRVAGDQARPPALRLSASIAQPVALGIVWPTIIVPEAFAESQPEAGLESVLAHEWAHIHNGDLRLLGVLRVLLPLLFAHPLYWWLRQRVRLDQELLADAWAARNDRVGYAESWREWSQSGVPRGPRFSGTIALWERHSLFDKENRHASRSQRPDRSKLPCPLAPRRPDIDRGRRSAAVVHDAPACTTSGRSAATGESIGIGRVPR